MFKKKPIESPWIHPPWIHHQYEGVVQRIGIAGTLYEETYLFILLENNPNSIQVRVQAVP